MASPATELPPGRPRPEDGTGTATAPAPTGEPAELVTQAEAAGSPGVGVVGRSPWQIFWRRFRDDRVAVAGAIFVLLLVLVAALAPILARTLAHHGPND